MNPLERLVGWAPQDEFEVGNKNIGSVLTRRAVRKLGPDIVNPFSTLISPRADSARTSIELTRSRGDEFMAPAGIFLSKISIISHMNYL